MAGEWDRQPGYTAVKQSSRGREPGQKLKIGALGTLFGVRVSTPVTTVLSAHLNDDISCVVPAFLTGSR